MGETQQRANQIITAIGTLLVLAFAIVAYAITDNIVDTRLQREFEHESSIAQQAIEARMKDYADVLFGVSALFETSDQISRDQFHRYVSALDLPHRYPGVRSINYAQIVEGSQKSDFEARVKDEVRSNRDGYPLFAIKPPGERPNYHVLIYLYPPNENESSFGMDIAANPQVAASLARSRDTGKLTSSGKLIRVEGSHQHIGLAMRLPVYKSGTHPDTVEARRAAQIGSVGAGFEIQKVMQGVLDNNGFGHMRFKLFDTGLVGGAATSKTAGPEQLLFDSAPVEPGKERPSGDLLTIRYPMQIGGRAWESHFSTQRSAMLKSGDRTLPWIALATAALIGLLTLGVFQSLIFSRREAVQIARRMTKDLRESEASLAEAQRMAHLGNWIFDPQNGAMTWSKEAYELLGRDSRNTRADYATFLQCFDEAHRVAVQQQLSQAGSHHDEVSAEHRVIHPDGRPYWVYMISRAGVDAQSGQICGTLMNITERKLIEQSMHEKNLELEASNLAKDRFLANMSHELRTPLNAILGFTGTLLMKLPGPLSADQEKQLQTIRSSGRHLLSLINDMLDLTKIESGNLQLNLEPIRCQSVIDDVAQTLRPLAYQKQLAFECDIPTQDLMLLTDRRALTQILINLINNAIKFTQEGEVRIGLRSRAVDGVDMIEITVSDTGIGIRLEDQDRLFQSFTQIDSTLSRPFEGTGLGLYLSQKLAELMNGKITCRSEFGRGSVFTLSMVSGLPTIA